MLKANGMFHTPKDTDELLSWIERALSPYQHFETLARCSERYIL